VTNENQKRYVKEIVVGAIQPQKVEMRMEHIQVFPVISSPLLSTVKWFRGKGSVQQKFSYLGQFEYQVCSHPKSTEEVFVPEEVKLTWQSTYYQRKGDEDLLDLDYYESNFSSYTEWSFVTHQRQVASLLEYVPESLRIVAPGDGWGVAYAACTKHKVLSTDIVRGIHHTESVEKTLDRLQEGDVLVLSYLWGMLTSEVHERVLSLKIPVILIDSYPFLHGFLRIGEGVFTVGTHDWFTEAGLSVTPEGFHEQTVAFTENLLNIEVRSNLVKTNAYAYHKAMRPLAKETKTGVVICSTIAEAIAYRKYLPYLAPIGKFYSEPWDTAVDMSTSWAIRHLYKIPVEGNQEAIKFIRKKAHWHQTQEFFFFCFSFPTIVKIKYTKMTKVVDVEISVADADPLDTHFRLVAVTKSHLMWKSNRIEPVVWKRTLFSQWCAYLYLHETDRSDRGWRRALFDKGSAKKPEMTPWEEHIISCRLQDEEFVPKFSNGLSFDDDWWTHQQCEIEIVPHGVMLFPTTVSVDTVESMLMSLYGQEARASTTGVLADIMKERGWKTPVRVTLHDPPKEILESAQKASQQSAEVSNGVKDPG
jgi:hypothetical protein